MADRETSGGDGLQKKSSPTLWRIVPSTSPLSDQSPCISYKVDDLFFVSLNYLLFYPRKLSTQQPSMSSMRNAVQRRNHKERGQVSGREKWGLLEKHKVSYRGTSFGRGFQCSDFVSSQF